jgi:hypothetical protein
MCRTGLSRRLIALVAAYGLALQAMLAGVGAPGAAFAAAICAPGHDWNSPGAPDIPVPPVPGRGSECPFCPLACSGSADLPPSGMPTAVRIYGAGAPMLPSPGAAPASRIVSRAGLARAPPV